MNPDIVFQNPAIEYPYLDPGFWFAKLLALVKFLIFVIFNPATGNLIQGIFYFLAIFFITIIAYTAVRMFEIRAKEHAHVHHEIAEYAHRLKEKEKKKREGHGISTNQRWVRILEHLSSSNVNDWKLAIIEADALMDVLFKDLAFKGENLGDRLKSANRDKFKNLTAAWEAHTVRNRIAHEGSAFELSLHEARRVIALYELVFREFGYI